ncbi:hypothetical protein ANCCAN_04325 [Ancylostoma caninum]|uniref:ATP-dependent DNA helicase n=1 Tax=Ancylostoma caninum TaxID=29170 RepID=A0A368GYW1_ANCCA|nr:hypothetical protein ANCCAN_04325 [Ancylostoma caninum]
MSRREADHRRANRERMRLARRTESQEQREVRLAMNAERQQQQRANESVEEREGRRARNSQSMQFRRFSESVEEGQQQRIANAERQARRRSNASSVDRNAERARNAQRQRSLRTRESSTDRRQRRSIARDAAERRANQLRMSSMGIARRATEWPLPHYLGRMHVECRNCGAFHFPQEQVGPASYGFNSCCNFGRVNLQLFEEFPAEIRRLFEEQDEVSAHFRAKIRNYNSGLAMASMTATVETPHGGGPYCFRVHGQVYHSTGALRPLPGQPATFAQIYIFDTEDAADELAGRPCNRECRRDLFVLLYDVMQRNNIFAQSYRMMEEIVREEEERALQENRQHLPVKMVFEVRNSDDRRRYNVATSNEVAAVFKGTDDEIEGDRRLIVSERSGQLSFITDYDPKCDPLCYPLLFPRGEYGWHPGMEKQRVQGRKRSKLTQREYYAYLLFPRNHFNPIHHAGKLMQQFVVDSWVKIEQNRLKFIRQNQARLRMDTYRGLQDFMIADESDGGPPGRNIILPASYTGSPRDMIAKYQDAMSIVARYGKPDLFITMTCNPQWKEIQESLFPGQAPSDRPDIVARVFKLKLDALLDDLCKKHILGEVAAHIWVVEFQKRGLPHAHILIILKETWKPRTAADVDEIVCAELPDKQTDPTLFEIVSKQMMHRPCGALNPSSPCMIDGKCSKKFPKEFTNDTTMGSDGYPRYRRRDDGRFVMCRGVRLSNTSVVPYNPYLSRKYGCHINVEVCSSITSVKYLYKYVYKGHDRARIRIHQEVDEQQQCIVDEVKAHLDTRYVCAPEGAHRVLEYPMQGRSDHVERLPVHLEEQQNVTFQPGEEEQAIAAEHNTKLTAWFELNRLTGKLIARAYSLESHRIASLAESSRQLCYHQIPEHYTWNDSMKKWQERRQRSRVVGRMYYVSPKDFERFALRLLLLYQKGATSFADLRSINNRSYDTYVEAARAAGFLNDDSFYESSMDEAKMFHMPSELRSFFASLICFCEVANPRSLWDRFKHDLSEDYRNQGVRAEDAESLAFHDIAAKTALNAVILKDVLHLDYDQVTRAPNVQDYAAHKRNGEANYAKLNEEQKIVVDAVLAAVHGSGNRCFFVDGPGGTGKTFVYNTIYDLLLGEKKNVACVAWSGIAASLLPEGRTVSSTFKLNPSDKNLMSTMTRQCSLAKELKKLDVVIWDEAPMAPKQALEAVDHLLRDITQTDIIFGNKIMLLGGDFRQVLPVVRKGGRAEMVAACIKNSPLWCHFTQYLLKTNMRVSGPASDWKKYILNIGDGKEPVNENGEMAVPQDLLCTGSLVNEIFAPFLNGQCSDLSEIAILTPKNAESLHISNYILDLMPGSTVIYNSVDSIVTEDPKDMLNLPTEFLNRMTPAGFPPHELRIKIGSIVMLLRNLDLKEGLCNGTRLSVVQTGDRVLGCIFACGSRKGRYVLIPRIDNYYNQDLPFTLKRRQFPLRLCFAITINKSQGQTFERVGICLNDQIFSHGQLYVALSRARSKEGVKIESKSGLMHNVVYPEVLQNSDEEGENVAISPVSSGTT